MILYDLLAWTVGARPAATRRLVYRILGVTRCPRRDCREWMLDPALHEWEHETEVGW